MKHVLMLVEGQTEETFVRDVLTPYLVPLDIFPTATLATTKRAKGSDGAFKGGIVSYGKAEEDLRRLLHDSSAALVTTLIDFFGIAGKGFPGAATMPTGDPYQQVRHMEAAWADRMSDMRFLPYFMLHEFEAMLFADTEQIVKWCRPRQNENHARVQLRQIAAKFSTPEEINTENPPSYRLREQVIYDKAASGAIIADSIGLDTIRRDCRHFDEWLTKLEML